MKNTHWICFFHHSFFKPFRIPTAMKQCGDTRWGDWRPHLAMILSNTVTTEINRRSIITLGDSLQAKGQLFAAQFCYIVSSADWGMRSNSCSKLVLLLSHAGDKVWFGLMLESNLIQ